MDWSNVLVISYIMHLALGQRFSGVVNVKLRCEPITQAVNTMKSTCTEMAVPIIGEITYKRYYKYSRCLVGNGWYGGRLYPSCINVESSTFYCDWRLPYESRRGHIYTYNLTIHYYCQPYHYTQEPSSTQPRDVVTDSPTDPTFSTASAGDTGGQVDTNGDQQSKQGVNRNEVVIIVATVSALVAAALIIIGAFIVHKRWNPLKRLRVRPASARVDNLYTRPTQVRHTNVQDRPLPDQPPPDRPLPDQPPPDQPPPDQPPPDRPRDNTEWMSIGEVQTLQVSITGGSSLQGQTNPGLAEGQESPAASADQVDAHPNSPDLYANVPGHDSQRPAAPGTPHYDVAAPANLDHEDSASYENVRSPKDSLPAVPPKGL